MLKQIKKSKDPSKKCTGYFDYLNHTQELLSSKNSAMNMDDFSTVDNLTRILAIRASAHNEETYNLLNNSKASKKQRENELFAMDIQRMTKNHLYYIAFLFAKARIDEYKFNDPAIKPLLHLLLKIYALYELQKDSQGLYECGFFHPGAKRLVDESMNKYL